MYLFSLEALNTTEQPETVSWSSFDKEKRFRVLEENLSFAKTARCRQRFVVPAFRFNGKVCMRSVF